MATEVVLLKRDYGKTFSKNSTTGIKVFISAAALPNSTSVDLPELGDSYDDDYIGLRVATIDESYIDDGCNHILYTVNYSTAAASEPDEDAYYPITVETGAEFQTYNDSKEESVLNGHWQWEDGTLINDFKARKKEITTIITIHREIWDLDAFLVESNSKIGKVNSITTSLNGVTVESQTCLYVGASISETRTANGATKWLAQLKFSVKLVPLVGGGLGGWNYTYRSGRDAYQLAKHSITTEYLYDDTLFDTLLTAGGI